MAQQDKIHEIDLLVPTLRYLDKSGGSLKTGDLTEKLTGLFQPSGINARLNANGLSAFSQIVRNIVSNRWSGRNMIHRGFATYDARRGVINITDAGRSLLTSIGFRTRSRL